MIRLLTIDAVYIGHHAFEEALREAKLGDSCEQSLLKWRPQAVDVSSVSSR